MCQSCVYACACVFSCVCVPGVLAPFNSAHFFPPVPLCAGRASVNAAHFCFFSVSLSAVCGLEWSSQSMQLASGGNAHFFFPLSLSVWSGVVAPVNAASLRGQ